MGLNHILILLPLVVPFVQSQGVIDTVIANATTVNANATIEEDVDTGTAPDYTPEECTMWLNGIVSSDADSSNGLSEPEYHEFLTSIPEPPYISEYFEKYDNFDDLPWPFRVVHKSLACHCEKLGYGEDCCKGGRAELLLLGLDTSANDMTSTEAEYKDLVCQQISYILSRSVPSPAPTDSPTESPSKSPSGSPTETPSASPVTPTPTASPVVPVGDPTDPPSVSLGPTITITQVIVPVVAPPPSDVEKKDDGLGTGGIIGIIVAILLALLAIIALVAYRRKLERDRLKQFAGEQVPEADLESPEPAAEASMPEPEPETSPEPEPAPEPDEDDESSAPSVWSESNADEEGRDQILDGDDPDVRVTAGSALAAMGAASTVASNLMSSPVPSKDAEE